MRRYRNARYAPESLERKLNPSGMGVAPPPAEVSSSVALTNTMPATPAMDSASVAPTVMSTATPDMTGSSATPLVSTIVVDSSDGYGFDGTDGTADVSTPGDPSMSDSDLTVITSPTSDDLLVDNMDDSTLPEESPVPIQPPLIPTGPVGPA